MKQTIRKNTFETNSSSIHTLTIFTESDLEKLNSGKYILDSYADNKLISKESILNDEDFKAYRKDYCSEEDDDEECIRAYCKDNSYEYVNTNGDIEEDDYDLEEDWTDYTSEHGDKLSIRCKYGRDG